MKLILPIILSTALLGCAAQPAGSGNTTTDRSNAKMGAIMGAVAGAIVGGQLDDDGNRDKGMILGAIAGAATGASIGNHMDKQEQAFRDALAAEQRRSDIEIERVREDLLKLTFDNEVTFDLNRADIKSSFSTSLNKVADVMQKYQSKGEVVGHTDSTGSESYNQALSERRAASVSAYLASHGVSSANLSSSGRGEYEPRESNATEAGRALNRRVEVFVTPISNQ
jgi:outer membrane protein OmpA-like peptidoglycan-associated protein